MRVMAWLKRLFSRQPARPENLSLEIDSIVEKFQIVKEAKRLASMGLPSFHEKKPTQKEIEVVEHLNLMREEIQRHHVRQSESIQSKVVGMELNYKALQSDALNAEFERQTRKLMDEQGDWLKKLAYNAMVRFKELEASMCWDVFFWVNLLCHGLSAGRSQEKCLGLFRCYSPHVSC